LRKSKPKKHVTLTWRRRAPLALQLPARIAKYELEEYLGGGMSEVYRARDTVIGRTVVVKILTEAGCADPDAKARFLQEARLAGNIEHPNVISIYDFGEDSLQRPYMVMEFLRGEDLRHAIRENHLGDLRAKLKVALQVARALGYIHTLGITHRDVKPENIHITPAGAVKLMDFGIAKAQGLSMTRTGFVVGTPYYMAPEQVLGKEVGPAVDIYAFGILFFELLAGLRPVTGDTVERIFYAILNEPLDLLPLKGTVPAAVCDLIAACTAKDAAARPSSFDAVAAEIERIQAQMEAPAPATATMPMARAAAPPRAKSARVKPWLAVALGIALVAAIAVLAKMALAPGHRPDTRAPAGTAQQAPVSTALPATLSALGGDMVLVSAGPFLYGQAKKPVTLPAFYIDKTEVTNAAYLQFSESAGHALPPGFPADKPDDPVVNVTIDDARAFARWARKRLPTAQEWEKAARGAQGRLFPWGDERNPQFANVRDNPSLTRHEIMPVGQFPAGASPYGALDMIGNVWEFVEETVKPDPANVKGFAQRMKPPPGPRELWYEIRGGWFGMNLADPSYGGAWDYSAVPARWEDHVIGFRCVKDALAH